MIKIFFSFILINNKYVVVHLPSQEWENNNAVAIFTYFILLIALPFNFLIFCYIGELIVEEVSLFIFLLYI